MKPMDDVPIRIGDADRDRAIERLRTAMAEGRLTYEEFDQRVQTALQAKYESDLRPLFVDLPTVRAPGELEPAQPDAPMEYSPQVAFPPGRRYRRAGVYLPLWPITFFILVASGWRLWWVIFVPMVLGPIIMSNQNRQRNNHRQLPPQ